MHLPTDTQVLLPLHRRQSLHRLRHCRFALVLFLAAFFHPAIAESQEACSPVCGAQEHCVFGHCEPLQTPVDDTTPQPGTTNDPTNPSNTPASNRLPEGRSLNVLIERPDGTDPTVGGLPQGQTVIVTIDDGTEAGDVPSEPVALPDGRSLNVELQRDDLDGSTPGGLPQGQTVIVEIITDEADGSEPPQSATLPEGRSLNVELSGDRGGPDATGGLPQGQTVIVDIVTLEPEPEGTYDIGTLEMTGIIFEPQTLDIGTLTMFGINADDPDPGGPVLSAPGTVPDDVSIALLSVRPLDGGTNPFDFNDVETDIAAAQAGAPTTPTGPTGPVPLNLVGSVTFAIPIPTFATTFGVSTIIQIGDSTPGSENDLYLSVAPTIVFDFETLSFSRSAGSNTFDAGANSSPSSPFTLTPNTVFMVTIEKKKLADFFQVNMSVSLDTTVSPNIWNLSVLGGFRCGPSITDCP